VLGDITDRESLRGRLDGAHTVVHLVGIIAERGGQTFESVHVKGTQNLVDEAKRAGVKLFFYQSALGADIRSWAKYQKTKAEAEEIVKSSGIPYLIFRPSLVVGGDDGFISKIRALIEAPSPVIPIPGSGRARFQPIYVEDWVRCFLKAIDEPSYIGSTIELGGPEHLTYIELVTAIRDELGSVKPLIHIPLMLVKLSAPLLGVATYEQIRLLEFDNITEIDSVKRHFGFEPMRFKDALRLFLKEG
jgi:NADH dehydrogenase